MLTKKEKRNLLRFCSTFTVACLYVFLSISDLQYFGPTHHRPRDLSENTDADSIVPNNNTSSKEATVMGMAYGYKSVRHYKMFVGSLRASGFEGHIILITSPLDELEKKTYHYLRANNVTLKPLQMVNCTHAPQFLLNKNKRNEQERERVTCGHPYPQLKLRWGRFALLRDYLEECRDCTGPVLITDFRDTFFQRDPFGKDAPPVSGLQVFEEDPQQTTSHWLTNGPLGKCKHRTMDEIMLCSGTTIGTRQAMLLYLEAMIQEMYLWMDDPHCNFPGNGDDQAIHNYLYYTGGFGHIEGLKSIPNGQGLVHTVGKYGTQAMDQKKQVYSTALSVTGQEAQQLPYTSEAEENKGNWFHTAKWSDVSVTYPLTDNEGYFVNSNGERSFVLHQYDRFGSPLERWLFQNGPCQHLDYRNSII